MKILVVGGGGREHSLVWAINKSPLVDRIFCAPGNGGTLEMAENIDIKADDISSLLKFARQERIDLTVVGPEVPLVEGIVDVFNDEGLTVFGPSKQAAMIEGSKSLAKSLMKKGGVPQASFEVFNNMDDAISYLRNQHFPIMIKANGLAAGKGAIAVSNPDEAEQTVKEIMLNKKFGSAGETIIIEEFLEGEEVSLLVLTDGENVLPFVPSQDHKQVYDNDKGPNTGGMGAYAPAPVLDKNDVENIVDRVVLPILFELKKEGIRYKGVLYSGLMITADGPRVLEFNCRFGDPESQAILPLLSSDLVEALLKTVHNELKDSYFEWKNKNAVCVILASGGYPIKYEKGKEIRGLEMLKDKENIVVFHAGTKMEAGKLLTSGGRVLGITGIGNSLSEAIKITYEAVGKVNFERMHYRRDIGKKGLLHIK
ncbi:MAG: phosphoribosylamine--glycine ligase [Candidatus Cloacimonas sp. 4484_209]|nr:MAG: phosphoribosylamine--glycine ligase [Candidatus Cloacimonas sp. 4484_209]